MSDSSLPLDQLELVEDAELKNLAEHDLVIHTGNVKQCHHIKAKLKPSTREEVVTALKCTLHDFRKYTSSHFTLSREFVGHPKLSHPIGADERDAKEITVKLFILHEFSDGFVAHAVESALKSLQVSKIDRLILSLCVPSSSALQSAWREAEHEFDQGHVASLGLADVSFEQLEAAQAWMKQQPALVHISAVHCCNLSAEFRAFTSKHGIKIISHQDDDDTPLTDEDFQYVMNKVTQGQPEFTPSSSPPVSPPRNSQKRLTLSWKPRWLARYHVRDLRQSIVDSTGYFISTTFSI